MSFGPVIGNRFSDAQRATPKPHLRERLALLTSRSTPLGNVATSLDGRLSFAPNYVLYRGDRIEADPHPMPRCALRPGQQVRVNATVAQLQEQHVFAFAASVALAVAGREGVVVECLEGLALTLVVVALDGEHWTFVPEYLTPAPLPAGGYPF
jgi:hypothetical protein